MSWKVTSPGVFRRPLSSTEQGAISYITAPRPSPREPVKINCVADFIAPYSTEKVSEALRDAWRTLRLVKEPGIATTFADGFTEYKVPSAAELEEWLLRTFEVKNKVTAEEAIKNMQMSTDFLPICQVLSQPTADGTFKGSIILFISHWRTEAGGCFKILNQLLAYAASSLRGGSEVQYLLRNHKPGSEISLLPPDIEELLMPNQPESSLASKIRVKAHFNNYYSHLPSIDYTLQGDLSTPTAALKLSQRSYSQSSTRALILACKSHNISVTAAIHSAYISAVRAVASPQKRSRPYASLMPAQVRTRLPPTSPQRDQGCWAATQMLMLAVPADLDFLDSAKSLKKQYALAGTEEWLYEDMRETSVQFGLMGVNAPKETEVSVMPYFTSLGVLDGDVIVAEHGDVVVEHVTAYADNISGGVVMHVWTFGGRMSIQLTWNEAYHGDEQIQKTLDHLDRVLERELALEWVVEGRREWTC